MPIDSTDVVPTETQAIVSRKKTSGGSYDVSDLFESQDIGCRRGCGGLWINKEGIVGVCEL